MNRIILGMATTNYVLLAITVYFGFLSRPPADSRDLGEDMFLYHFPMGIFTALFTMLVHCMVFTYFLGTNRWVRETSAAYRLSSEFAMKSRACRTRALIVAMIGILLVVFAVATGAGAHTHVWPLWLHWAVPTFTYVFMLFAFRIQVSAVEEHIELTDRVMDEVNRIRRERGQPVD